MNPSAPPILAHLSGSSIITIAALVVCGIIGSGYAVRTAISGRRRERRAEKEGGTAFVNLWTMEAFYWGIRAPGRMFARLGVSPDALTWASLVLCVAAVPAAALGHFSTAGVLIVGGAILDALDGMVARELGIASDAGEMLDAVIDRYADAAPLLGLVVFYRFSLWQMAIPLAAFVGSMMVSYVRAKSEAMQLKMPSGLMRRHERITYVSVALILGPELSPWLKSPWGAIHPATLVLVAFVALISNVVAIRLAQAARRELVRLGRGRTGGSGS